MWAITFDHKITQSGTWPQTRLKTCPGTWPLSQEMTLSDEHPVITESVRRIRTGDRRGGGGAGCGGGGGYKYKGYHSTPKAEIMGDGRGKESYLEAGFKLSQLVISLHKNGSISMIRESQLDLDSPQNLIKGNKYWGYVTICKLKELYICHYIF